MITGDRFTVKGKIPLTDLRHGQAYEILDIVSRDGDKMYKLTTVDVKGGKPKARRVGRFLSIYAIDFEIWIDADGDNKIIPNQFYNKNHAPKKREAAK